MSYKAHLNGILHQATDDLTGEKYSKLTVLEFHKYKTLGKIRERKYSSWKCLCDCGKIVEVLSKHLKSGSTKSCGCHKSGPDSGTKDNLFMSTDDLIGKKFGRLVVKEFYDYKQVENNGNKVAFWLCDCDCGNTKITRASLLKNGKSLSCGCLKRENMSKIGRERANKYKQKQYGTPLSRQVYHRYKHSAGVKNIEFMLDYNELLDLVVSNCFYCGTEPMTVLSKAGYGEPFKHNGIDRIDSDKGYTLENCVPCCWKCNRAKNQDSVRDFKEWVKKAYTHLYREDK